MAGERLGSGDALRRISALYYEMKREFGQENSTSTSHTASTLSTSLQSAIGKAAIPNKFENDVSNRPRCSPRLSVALLPVLALVLSLFVAIRYLEASPHIPIIFASVVAGLISVKLGRSWTQLQDSIVKGISLAVPSILILMAIGMLIGVWVASGIVPLLIDYGLHLLSPNYFLVASCLICAAVSLATGSSWSTIGTVGVALVGAGQGLDLSLPMVAGAVVSGSYFGDKLSPLSETTNLAPAVAGSELFEHIKHMLYTTAPSMLIALTLYFFLGLQQGSATSDLDKVNALSQTLNAQFVLSPLLLIAPISLIALIALKIPALPAILCGAFIGGIGGILFQDMSLAEAMAAMLDGYVSETGIVHVDELLTRGGMSSMVYTLSLIICSMAFGGLMEGAGFLQSIAQSLLNVARSSGRIVASTIGTCIGMNIIAPDQYLSIIMPGRMYKSAFQEAKLAPKNLSRCLEDAGTLTSPLVPWNTCGVFVYGALLVDPFAYLPFAFLNLINPVLSLVYGFTGWTMAKADNA